MADLESTSLSPLERRVLARFVALVEAELGSELGGVWLYGSRARGEPPGEDSDVDLLVVAPIEDWREQDRRIGRLADAAADAEGASPFDFSVLVYTPEQLAQRREIESFFIQEVDRDKIVLAGRP